jgi:hypothetical protein
MASYHLLAAQRKTGQNLVQLGPTLQRQLQ